MAGTQWQRTDAEVAHDLARALAREERRRKRLARALTGVGAVVLLFVVLAGAGLAMRGSASSAASAAVTPPTELAALAAQSQSAAGDAPQAPASAADPANPTESAPAKKAAPTKKALPKLTAVPKPAPTKRIAAAPTPSATPQHFKIAIGGAGYQPVSITAKAGSSITLVVGKGEGCAAGFNMPELGVAADNSSGPVTVKLGKLKPGSYTYTCSMGMVSGTLRVR